MRNMVDRLEQFWCLHMHKGVMWPIRGHYLCRECHREYPVAFESRHAAGGPAPVTVYEPVPHSLY